MAVKSVVVENNLQPNTEFGPTEAIWAGTGNQPVPGGYWVADFIQDPRLGYHFFDTFDQGAPSAALGSGATTGNFGKWGMYAYANATLTDGSQPGAVLNMICGTTSNQGIALSSFAGCVQLASSNSTPIPGYLAFECRVAINSISTAAAAQYDMFIGLSDLGSPGISKPISAAALNSTMNAIGFYRQGSVGNDWQFVYQKANLAPVFPTNLQTLVSSVTGSALTASQFVKLGFIFNPSPVAKQQATTTTGNSTIGPANPMITIFVNGQSAGAGGILPFLTKSNVGSSNFPQGVLGPTVAVLNASTTTGLSASVDWIRLAQSNWQ